MDRQYVHLSDNKETANCCVYDTGIISIRFSAYLKYTFGMPGNETIMGHPYSELGMGSCAFYELKNSDLIKSLQEIQKVHPYYNPSDWEKYKHYILTFHDNMFECVAMEFEIREDVDSLYNQIHTIVNKLFEKNI